MPTIQSAEKIKTLDGNAQRGPLDVYKVTLDSGQEAEMLRKPASGAPSGEVTVEQTQHGLRAKLLQTGGPGRAKDFHADPKKLRSENARSALHAAKDLVIADKIKLEDFGTWTGKFYEFIENKAKVDS